MIDLHVHTTASDGRLSPTDVVAAAAERGLDAIAITDHDVLSGIEEARAAAPHGLEI
ncbi:MAG: PHP domain-containing protein, partial [Chloroflexi bacterium]|nr:PHP domain-containing protein [Chloroflexota bacterium]